jgi:integrase
MAEKTFRFTKSAIDQLPIPTLAEAGSAGYVMYWDMAVAGFGVVVRPSGLMTFILVYRNKEGRVRRLKIGRYGRLTVDQARQAAKQHNGKVVLGGDPVADKRRDRSAKTVDEVFAAYLDRHIVPNGSEHAERSVKRVRKMIKKSLGGKFIHAVESVDVNECLEPYHNQRGNYNLILTYVRAAWNWARQHGVGLTKQDSQNPVDGIEPKPSTPQGREVTPAEYKAVFEAIDELMAERRNDPARLLACLFVIETGCRPIEAVRLRRDKVYRARAIAELYEHKMFKRTGEPKVFFLTPAVLGILDRADALHVLRGVKCEFVFPRRKAQKASNWLAKTWNSVRKRAGVDLELRHFRSGYINLADDAGVPENQIPDITQHASPETVRRHYRVIKQKRASKNANSVAEWLQQYRSKTSNG